MGAEEAVETSLTPQEESSDPIEDMAEEPMDNIEDASNVLYVMRELIKDDDSLEIPYTPLAGESPLYLGSTTDGIICLSNYRLFVSINPFFNIPLGLIEQLECRDIYHLYIYCKDARTFRCTFSDNPTCQKWYGRVQDEIMPKELDQSFAFIFLSWSRDVNSELYRKKFQEVKSDIPHIFEDAARLGFDFETEWRITEANINHNLCPSYPRHIIVPKSITDTALKKAADFRYSNRIPAVVWRHKKNGCVIARCSQPKVGLWFRNRCEHDEMLIQSIADACARNPGSEQRPIEQDLYSLPSELGGEELANAQSNNRSYKISIIDARSYTAAVANRAKGGGSETGYYENCEVIYQGLANIHSIRKSFQSLRLLCSARPDPTTWLSALEATSWLQYILSLLVAALQVINAIDLEHRVVLVHCSDGWDRTSQIVALAELMLDPFYRTKKGFQILIEREWLEFGHKFADRCGNSNACLDQNERSPVFLQWLDCVYQLIEQFPTHFEFNKQYLVKLVYYTYSGLFGTFLCNTDKERRHHRISMRTFSVWSYLNDNPHFHNNFFEESSEVLRPSCLANNVKFWNELYFPTACVSSGLPPQPNGQELVPKEFLPEEPGLVKTKSYEDIPSVCHSSDRQRRSSDTSIGDLACFVEKMEKDSSSAPQDPISTEDPEEENSNDIFINNTDDKRRTTRTDSECSYADLCCESPNIISLDSLSLVSESSILPGNLQDTLCASVPVVEMDTTLLGLECNGVNEPKKSASGSSSNEDTPCHSRSPSSSDPDSPCNEETEENDSLPKEFASRYILDIDRSVLSHDEIQNQVRKMLHGFKTKIRRLQRDLDELKKASSTSKESAGRREDECATFNDTSICKAELLQFSPDEDFEKVELQKLTLWLPDHAVDSCMMCNTVFTTLCRRHHCRTCGRIFCSTCSCHKVPVPMQKLFNPVRVCVQCFSELQRQCRQSVASCDKLQKPAIPAVSN